MLKLDDIEQWANDLKPVLFDISLALRNLHILKDERLTFFKVNYFEAYINLLYQQHFVLVIQLDKIFTNCKWHSRNVHALFLKIEKDELDPEILDTNKIANYKNKIEILLDIHELKKAISESKNIISRIRSLRNKVFAHTDLKYPDGTIEIEEYAILENLSYKIYNTLFGEMLGRNYILNHTIARCYDLSFLLDLLRKDTEQ